MAASGTKSSPSIGFLTVNEVEGQGLFGGYLVLNAVGRPLEFQCTAPVKANRAQEILYGRTLKPYLYGERIGFALLEKSKIKPALIFTDAEPALSLRTLSSVPVVLVEGDDSGAAAAKSRRLDAAHDRTPPHVHRLHRFHLADQRLALPEDYRNDENNVVQTWQAFADGFDLFEPFGRIHDAINEARGGGK